MKLLMKVFELFRSEFPDSSELASIYAVITRMYNDYDRPNKAARYAKTFMNNYPDDPRYYDVVEEMLKSLQKMKQQCFLMLAI